MKVVVASLTITPPFVNSIADYTFPWPAVPAPSRHWSRSEIGPLINPRGSSVLEASGVVAKDGYYYVIFNNVRRVARVHSGLEPGSDKHSWFGGPRDGEG
jgi:hypothetical protein